MAALGALVGGLVVVDGVAGAQPAALATRNLGRVPLLVAPGRWPLAPLGGGWRCSRWPWRQRWR